MKVNDGFRALITGASRGLGQALANELAGRGWHLILTARNQKALQEAVASMRQANTIVAVPGDIGDPVHRLALADAAGQLGGLDALINNAGALGVSPLPGVIDYPLAALEELFRVNIVSQLGILQALREHLGSGSSVVNVSSDAALHAYQGWGGYGASKAALDQLGAVLAIEHPQWRVYQVDPGDMRTEMHQAAFPGEDISDRPWPDDSAKFIADLISGDRTSGRYVAGSLPEVQVAL